MSETKCVVGCPSIPKPDFFPLPINEPEKLKQWCSNMNIKKEKMNKDSRICKLHFEEEMIIKLDTKSRRPKIQLSSEAIPTLLPKKNVQIDKSKIKSSKMMKIVRQEVLKDSTSNACKEEKKSATTLILNEDYKSSDIYKNMKECVVKLERMDISSLPKIEDSDVEMEALKSEDEPIEDSQVHVDEFFEDSPTYIEPNDPIKPLKAPKPKKEEIRKKKDSLHDKNGVHLSTKLDLCDCLSIPCTGCFFDCKICESRKCSGECRIYRTYIIEELEYESSGGHSKKINNASQQVNECPAESYSNRSIFCWSTNGVTEKR